MEEIRSQLVEFGFNPNRITRALKATKAAGLQEALDWIDAHGDDEGVDDPIEEEDAEEGKEEEGITNCLVCNDCGKMFTSVAFAQLHASKTGHEDFSESTEAIPVLTEEQKKERLAQLKEKLAEKRKQDELQRQEEEKKNELIRRKATKDTAAIRREMEEKEMKKELDKRMREKEEDRIQKERVKAQIEEDRKRMKERAEEEKRRNQGLAMEQKQVELKAEASTIKSDSARLQIRLPNGSALRETLEATKTLNDLMALIESKSEFASKSHLLMVALPPRNFDQATEGSKTLQDLGFCPSATLVLRKRQ